MTSSRTIHSILCEAETTGTGQRSGESREIGTGLNEDGQIGRSSNEVINKVSLRTEPTRRIKASVLTGPDMLLLPYNKPYYYTTCALHIWRHLQDPRSIACNSFERNRERADLWIDPGGE